ncbi:single-stranded DNA-binding protein, partial [Staphylococcus aureus]|uniref:single-stranded DNA-binding protein n=1 Tax=Staphylococcus aureus TaxID=1280 RepID=UPI001160461B
CIKKSRKFYLPTIKDEEPEKYTNQGTLVGITGQMRSRKYDKDGQTHFVTELYVETIKFMSPKSQNNEILSDSILDIDSQNIDNHDLLEI